MFGIKYIFLAGIWEIMFDKLKIIWYYTFVRILALAGTKAEVVTTKPLNGWVPQPRSQ